jgi:hypothetical protein
MVESPNDGWWVAGCAPRGEGFGVNGRKLVDLIRVPKRNAADGVANGAQEWDEEGGDGGFRMVTEAEAAAFNRVMSKQVGERRDVGGDISDHFEKVGGCFVKGGGEVGAPCSERWGVPRVIGGVVEDVGKEEMVKGWESAKTKKGCDGLRVGESFGEANGGSVEIAGGGEDEGATVGWGANWVSKVANAFSLFGAGPIE